MKSVYQASTGVEAHMVANLLEQSGISAKVEGEYLQGGVGELQALNIVRVMVDEADVESAREIIDRWESQQPVSEDADSGRSRTGLGLAWFLAGIVVGGGVAGATVYSLYNYPVDYEHIDYNGDGLTDSVTKYTNERIAQVKYDRDFDGAYDTIIDYNRKGYISKSKSDDDFDGEFDSHTFYRNGSAFLRESDTNGDGRIDLRANYRYGRLREVEIIGPAGGYPRKVQYYQNGKLHAADYDGDGDGNLETHYQYDFFEEISSVERQNDS